MITALWTLAQLVSQSPSVEIVSPENYSVKRFQEVVAENLGNSAETPEEKLIEARARLVVAERRLQELRNALDNPSKESPKEEPPKPQALKAAEARVDHYRIKIAELEKKTLKEKRRERKKQKN